MRILRKWPPSFDGLPYRVLIIQSEDGQEIEMAAQYDKPFIGRLGSKVLVIDDNASWAHAFVATTNGAALSDVRILTQYSTLDEAATAVGEFCFAAS